MRNRGELSRQYSASCMNAVRRVVGVNSRTSTISLSRCRTTSRICSVSLIRLCERRRRQSLVGYTR
jgi:hypothetical protein